jgi:hypothetical protein
VSRDIPAPGEDLDAYVATYFANLDRAEREDSFGTGPIISELVYELDAQGRCEEAWPIVLALINAAPTESALGFVAADTLELIMRSPSTTDGVHRRMVNEATVNPKLRDAFRLVYWWGGEPDWFRSEIAALGVSIP